MIARLRRDREMNSLGVFGTWKAIVKVVITYEMTIRAFGASWPWLAVLRLISRVVITLVGDF